MTDLQPLWEIRVQGGHRRGVFVHPCVGYYISEEEAKKEALRLVKQDGRRFYGIRVVRVLERDHPRIVLEKSAPTAADLRRVMPCLQR